MWSGGGGWIGLGHVLGPLTSQSKRATKTISSCSHSPAPPPPHLLHPPLAAARALTPPTHPAHTVDARGTARAGPWPNIRARAMSLRTHACSGEPCVRGKGGGGGSKKRESQYFKAKRVHSTVALQTKEPKKNWGPGVHRRCSGMLPPPPPYRDVDGRDADELGHVLLPPVYLAGGGDHVGCEVRGHVDAPDEGELGPPGKGNRGSEPICQGPCDATKEVRCGTAGILDNCLVNARDLRRIAR